VRNPYLSIVIPIHNGLSTFAVVFPFLLAQMPRVDTEFIVVDNASTDGLADWVTGLSDPRLTLVTLAERVSVGYSLSAGIEKARGEWIYYLGDDDQVVFSLVDIVEDVSRDESIGVVLGGAVRFNWPIDGLIEFQTRAFSGNISIISSADLYRSLINQLSINAGGSFAIRRKIYEKLYRRYGFYSSPQGVEFFILRASLLFCERVAVIDLPFFVHGRGAHGWGNSVKTISRWNDDSEWKDAFCLTTFWAKKLYTAISYDAAVLVNSQNGEYDVKIDERYWSRRYIDEIVFSKSQRLEAGKGRVFRAYIQHVVKSHGVCRGAYLLGYVFVKLFRELGAIRLRRRPRKARVGYEKIVTIRGESDHINTLALSCAAQSRSIYKRRDDCNAVC
jgi:glycosyltransferase involved in cell wall biosynthesis